MWHAGAVRKSPHDAPWETLALRLCRLISAPLITVARAPAGTCRVPAPLLTVTPSWRHEEEELDDKQTS